MVEPRNYRESSEALGAFLRSISGAGYELRRVGPHVPTGAWSDLFDELVTIPPLHEACNSLFRTERYARAVEEAFKCLNHAVAEKSGLTQRDGADLMRAAFSANSPVIKLNSLHTVSDQNEQRGYMDIYAGAMTGIRNPRAHDYQLIDNPETALEMIVLANHLMRKLNSSSLSS